MVRYILDFVTHLNHGSFMSNDTSSKGHIIGYARVSSADQDTARQLGALNELGLNKLFEDKASGKDTKRPALQEAMDYVREGDTLAVHSLDRLARNLANLLSIVEELTTKGVSVKFLKENLVFTGSGDDPFAKLMLQMLGSVAEFERSLIRERQREGIALAKKRGAYAGRKQSLNEGQIKELKETDDANHGKGRTALAEKFGISRKTLYRYLAA